MEQSGDNENCRQKKSSHAGIVDERIFLLID